MQINERELAVINYAIAIEDGKPRTFQVQSMHVPVSIFSKVSALSKDGAFIPGDIELSTQEKALAIECIEGTRWTVADGEPVISLLEKLK